MSRDWLRAADLADDLPAQPAWLRELLTWVTEFVGRPRPEMSRGGDVCPFVRPALRKNTILVGISELDGGDLAAICDELLGLRADFLALAPAPPDPEHVNKALVHTFPRISSAEGALLKRAREVIKPAFLEVGLTCGEFYDANEDRSVRAAELRIAASPVPCLAVRYLMPHDELFLKSQPDLYPIYEAWRRAHSSS